jgi:S-adenosylmethionine hydrolase
VVNFTADDLARIIYVDHYGNAWTGLRGEGMEASDVVTVGQHVLKHAPTFGEAARGQPFWYINSVGLVEIAANRASAAETLSLNVGEIVTLSRSPDNRLH